MKNIFKVIGINKAIGFTVFTRLLQAGGGVFSILLISLFLSREEQGYFYTFGSIIAIQVFFEVGLNTIITQYVAHEMVNLTWISSSKLEGSKENLSRLSSLLHFCVKIFSLLALIFVSVLIFVGFIFFTKYNAQNNVDWKGPWITVSITTALMFLINPILAFLEGLNQVESVAKLRLIQQCTNIVVLTVVFAAGGGLYSLGIASMSAFLVLFIGLFYSNRYKLLRFIYNQRGQWKISYFKEIFPYQYKIAISWMSSYFIFQLFNPVLFATEGPIVAGQMGLTLQALNGISSLSLSWINTKVPTFSTYIAKKKYSELDQVFNKTLLQLSAVNSFLVLTFIVGIVVINTLNLSFATRFLPFIPLLVLCFVTIVNQLISCWATYLRCHKKEPFLVNSITIGILTALSTILLGKFFGLKGIVYGYGIISVLLALPWAYFIFRKKKLEWHAI